MNCVSDAPNSGCPKLTLHSPAHLSFPSVPCISERHHRPSVPSVSNFKDILPLLHISIQRLNRSCSINSLKSLSNVFILAISPATPRLSFHDFILEYDNSFSSGHGISTTLYLSNLFLYCGESDFFFQSANLTMLTLSCVNGFPLL